MCLEHFVTENSSTEYITPHSLGQVDYLLNVYNISNSRLFLLNNFNLTFSWRDSESQL